MTDQKPGGDPDKVVLDSAELEGLLESQDDQVVALLAEARTLRDQGDLDGAADKFQKAIDRDKVCMAAYLGLAGIHTLKNDMVKAFELLARATTQAKKVKDQGEDQAEMFFFLGEMELQLNNLAEALGFFKEADEKSPQDGRMQVRIADSLLDSGQLKESAEYYEKALVLDPEPAHAYNRLGIIYRKQGRHDLAQALYRKALVFHPQDEHLLYNLARVLFQGGDSAAALKVLDEALGINPEFVEAVELKEIVERAGKKPS